MLPRLFVLEAAAAAAAAARYQMSWAGGREERGDLICVRAENASHLSFPFPPTQRRGARKSGTNSSLLYSGEREVGKYVKMFPSRRPSRPPPKKKKNTFFALWVAAELWEGRGRKGQSDLENFYSCSFFSSFLFSFAPISSLLPPFSKWATQDFFELPPPTLKKSA